MKTMNLAQSIRFLRNNGYGVSELEDGNYIVYKNPNKSFYFDPTKGNHKSQNARYVIKFARDLFRINSGNYVKRYKGYRAHEKNAIKKENFDAIPQKKHVSEDDVWNWT